MFRNAVLALALGAGLGFAAPVHAADPNLANQWVAYGQKLYAAQQYDQATQAFSTAARANSAEPLAWRGLGNCFYAKRDYADALKYYRYSLQLNPNDAQLAAFVQRLASVSAQSGQPAADPMALGTRYYQAGQYDYAIQQFNVAATSNPNNARAFQGLGNCYYAKGDKPHAVEAYKRALQINPDNNPLKAFLARYAPEAAQSEGVQVAKGPADWPQPLWRSAILPGWGQSYNGESTKGWIIGSLTIASLVGAVATYEIGAGARHSYETLGYGASQSQFTNDYNTWNNFATYNNVLAITFLALYSFNLVDAILGAKPATTAVGLGPDDSKPVQVGLLQNGTYGARLNLMQF